MKQMLVLLFFINSCLVYGQQLLTPYNSPLSATAQQMLQQYQADATLNFIGIYEVNGKVLYDSSINVIFGNNSLQFFLDRKGETAMTKFWQGTSIYGDEVSVLHKGSNAYSSFLLSNGGTYKLYNLDYSIHALFIENYIPQIDDDKCGFIEDESLENATDKSGPVETHCPLRIGIGITDRLLVANGRKTIHLEVLSRILQSNNVYLASRSNGLFDGISVELAYIRYFPNYSEIKSNDTMKLENTIMTEFSQGILGTNDGPASMTRDYFDADFCGLIYESNDVNRTGGGLALGHSASYHTAFFLLDENAAFENFRFSFTHEIGHLFGCSHDFNNVRSIYKNSYFKGHFSLDEEWCTVMSYRQNDVCTRVGFHSNPFLNSSLILSPPTTDLVRGSFPSTLNLPMGTEEEEFCINGIAKNYLKEINLEATSTNRFNTAIRTDGVPINTPVPNTSPNIIADQNTFYADLLTLNDITFSGTSFITNNYERLIRAGNSTDINSNGDNSFIFDAQNGAVVDIVTVDFANSPFDCEPHSFRYEDKSGNTNNFEPATKIEEFLSVYPNPTIDNPYMNFNLAKESNINLWITNLLGQTVRIIKQDEVLPKGEYHEKIDITGLPAGVYQVSITVNNVKKTTRLIIAK
jgi:hypothetical protein